jgi:hypothetical protein
MAENRFLRLYRQAKASQEGQENGGDACDEKEYYDEIQQFEEYLNRSMTISLSKWKEDYIISYYSKTRLKFEFVTCILILYDCVVLPVHLAFEGRLFHRAIDAIDYLIKLVFIMDLLMGFRKAFISEDTGIEIRNPWTIAKQYLKFYFWVDLISGLPLDLITDNHYLRLLVLVKIVRLRRLKKIITFLNFSLYTRVRIRVFYLIARMLIIMHWVTCFFHYQVNQNYLKLKEEGKHLPWTYNYWIPQVDMAKGVSNYYQLANSTQYYHMFYYCVLLVIGNDIMPATSKEVLLCTGVVFCGAFLEAYIIGGITAEQIKKEDRSF